MSQNTFATFAREVQYTPPPDSKPLVASASSAKPSWFASPSAGPVSGAETSYQAGGVPSWGDSYGGGGGEQGPDGGAVNEWETRFGWRVDFEAALAYLLGPISGADLEIYDALLSGDANMIVLAALALLILETKNDFIRFHGVYMQRLFSFLRRQVYNLTTYLNSLPICHVLGSVDPPPIHPAFHISSVAIHRTLRMVHPIAIIACVRCFLLLDHGLSIV